MKGLHVEFVLRDGDRVLCRGAIRCGSDETTYRFAGAAGHEFHISARFGERPGCSVQIICYRDEDQLYDASLCVGVHTSSDWESINVGNIHTLSFRCRKEHGRGWLRTVLAYGLAIGMLVLYSRLAMSRSEYDAEFNLVRIERVNPAVASGIGWLALAAAVVLLVLSLISLRRPVIRWPALGLLIAVILYPVSVAVHTFRNLAPWTVHGKVTGTDAAEYVFCDSSFLQGQMMAIAEVTDVGLLKSSYRVLVVNNGDSPRSWASVIRPANASDEYGQLYICRNRYLVGIRHDNSCYLAYDLRDRVAFGHGRIETLSPFVCLDGRDEPDGGDLERTCHRIRKHAEFCMRSDDRRCAQSFLDGASVPGCPPLADVRSGLDADSPGIRSAAAALLTCYDEALARVRSRVSSSEDVFDSATRTER